MAASLVPLTRCGMGDAGVVGRAAAALGELAAEGVPVPDGGVLHCRRGRRFAPSQVNSVGNAPAARSGLKTVSGEGCP